MLQNTWVRVIYCGERQRIHWNVAIAWIGCVPSIVTRWGISLPLLNRDNEVDDWDRVYWYKYQSVHIIITFSNAKTGADAVLLIMGHLKLRHNSRLAFDPSYPNINHSNFWGCYWNNFSEGEMEAIPSNASSQRGQEVDLLMFVNSIHAGNKWNRRCISGFMIYMNVMN